MPETALTTAQRNRYEICTKTILKALDAEFDGGIALIEVRDSKLYRDEFKTLEEYCDAVLKISRRRAYQLIEAAEVKESLPPKASEQIVNEHQARALVDVPENQRAAVIKEASKSGPLTAAIIESTASKMCKIVHKDQSMKSGVSLKTPAKNGVVDIDKVGRPIPEEIQSLWQDHLAQELLTQLSHVKSALEKLMKNQPIHWWEVNLSGTLVDLQKVWSAVECAKPYAVCPYCQGVNRKNCTRCKSWGFVSEYRWKTAVTKDMKELAVKGARK